MQLKNPVLALVIAPLLALVASALVATSISAQDLVLRNADKVRDIYEVDDEHLLFVTSDRVSAFDVLMPQGIPHKGRVLTAIAAWWFERTRDLVANHLGVWVEGGPVGAHCPQ